MPAFSRTLVCAPVMVEQFDPALTDAKDAAAHGADLVEFRLDPAMDADVRIAIASAQRLVDHSPIPCIVTCRTAREGGAWEGDEADRIDLFEAVCDGLRTPAYIDIEFASWRSNPELQRRILAALDRTDGATGLILSAHDFDGRPANLYALLRDMQNIPHARILKIAFRARSVRDTLDIAEILAHADRPTIALAMGEAGTPSRILAGKWGAFLTFASLREADATAPGQPTVRDLLDTYRFRSITPHTRVFGVVGWPVTHSIGWRIHNAVFDALGFDGVYMRLPVAPEWESFKATILTLLDDPRCSLGGVSVTLPHKEHLLRLAREDRSRAWDIDPLARTVGAANTLAVRADGACWVGNTDVHGVVTPLAHALSGAVTARRIAVLGAGGAARAAAIGLAGHGAHITILARRVDRAEAIAADGRDLPGTIEAAPWDAISTWTGDAIVHCTPVGMAGTTDADRSPIDDSTLHRWGSRVVVMDTVYRPAETALVRAARDAGCPVVLGTEMYRVQAEGQIRAWTGETPPKAVIERGMHAALASSSHG